MRPLAHIFSPRGYRGTFLISIESIWYFGIVLNFSLVTKLNISLRMFTLQKKKFFDKCRDDKMTKTRWKSTFQLFFISFLIFSCENLEQKKVGKYLLTCSRVVLNTQRHFMFSDVFFISNHSGVVSFSSQKNCGSCRRN